MMETELNKEKRQYISKWIRQTKKIVLSNIDTENYAVFLYGSRVTRQYSNSSDLDIGVLGKKPLEKKVILSIQKEIENSKIPFSIDIVDFYYADNKFKDTALKEIDLWNAPKHIDLN